MMMLIVTLLSVLLGSSWAQAPALYSAPCDAQSIDKAARLAITAVNEDRREGYKLSLNRINKAVVHDQGPAGTVTYMDLDVLETKCYARSVMPWEDCEIRPFVETKVSGTCSVALYEKPWAPAAQLYLHSYTCLLIPDTKEDVTSICPDCLVLIDVNSSDATHALGLSMLEFNAMSNKSNYFAPAQVLRAASLDSNQKGQEYHIEFVIKETDCVKRNDTMALNCTFKSPAQTGFCVSGIYVGISITIEMYCDFYDLQEAKEPQKHELGLDVHDGTPKHSKALIRGKRMSKKRSGDHNVKKFLRPRYRKKDDSSESNSSEERGRAVTSTKKHSTVFSTLSSIPPTMQSSRDLPPTMDLPPSKELPLPEDLSPGTDILPSEKPPQSKDVPPAEGLTPVFFETFPDLPPHVQTCPGEAIHLIL
ncbi:fetuin-B isoform X2 [Microcaecilia unicolor]|uniref:Fetuin-B-like isoform X2 n=1 Tax=Microcaecilia unicolor TaxID=1415580 RepID=A0A6P7Z0N4_9AMPH|nr:fetuin-B-like isoform X2 [Microcaecilia unicolor]